MRLTSKDTWKRILYLMGPKSFEQAKQPITKDDVLPLLRNRMKESVILATICFMLLVGCQQNSDKKNAYELQERCGIAAKQWANQSQGEVLSYRAHYNSRLNKCFVLATLSPLIVKGFSTSFEVIYDVNENKKQGQYRSRYYENYTPPSYQTIIEGESSTVTTVAQAKEKWDAFVKKIMEE